MKKRIKLHEEPGKIIYSTDESEQLIQEFNDDVIVGNKTVTIEGKGEINNQVSAFLLKYLSGFHIPTHFIKKLGNKDMLVRSMDMIPVEVVIHNIANKNLSKRFGIEGGKKLSCPIMEFYYKNDSNQDPMMNNSHIIALGIANADELKIIERLTSKINAVLKSFYSRRQIELVDCKLEFGRHKNKIMLGAGISLDSCRLMSPFSETGSENNKFQFAPGDEYEKYEQIRDLII
ncbi:phosphoribosylaminoimidazolesuccinocarboxamide synthase [candidate division KSB1 bacterium]|nr:phosphoribosylaminoimidazolesuccinocarboxamide synthase [candidate division KSB1 bacterium]